MEHENNDAHGIKRFRFWLPVSIFAVLIGVLLLFEHRSHIPNNLAFVALILGLCIGMHFFMHGTHGGHSNREGAPKNDNSEDV
ncbi:MAG: DUF2933 domain-containing protein [Robiginitomaculum sp.]|nr:DUF2933 domain-containing protein [Robiginitomaculum sp.]